MPPQRQREVHMWCERGASERDESEMLLLCFQLNAQTLLLNLEPPLPDMLAQILSLSDMTSSSFLLYRQVETIALNCPLRHTLHSHHWLW